MNVIIVTKALFHQVAFQVIIEEFTIEKKLFKHNQLTLLITKFICIQ